MLSLSVLAVSAVDLPSFNCGPKNSPIEAAICGDPELAAYDRAMAFAYVRMKPAARATQRDWLAERNRCSAARKIMVCIRRSYTDRLLMDGGIFGTLKKPESAAVPTFLRSQEDSPGGLSILDVGGGKFVYHLWATFYSYANDPDHPQEISGDQFGVIKMSGEVGRDIATPVCDFTIKRHANGWVISDAGACLGMNNNPDGTYFPKRR
jgi:hypothetical protein